MLLEVSKLCLNYLLAVICEKMFAFYVFPMSIIFNEYKSHANYQAIGDYFAL